jgi:hyperosmotically inducible periplasmic protein
MRIHLASLLIVGLAGAGACKSKNNPPAADNTQKNERDRAVTPTADQGAQSGDDLALTQKIRKAIVDDGSLSTNAHNCKIVVTNGVATLVGPVETPEEKTRLETIATAAGATSVVDQLEVKRG